MKALELHKLNAQRIGRKSGRSEGRTVQPSIPAGNQPARQHTRLREVRREIARIKTVMREQEIAAWERLQEEG